MAPIEAHVHYRFVVKVHAGGVPRRRQGRYGGAVVGHHHLMISHFSVIWVWVN